MNTSLHSSSPNNGSSSSHVTNGLSSPSLVGQLKQYPANGGKPKEPVGLSLLASLTLVRALHDTPDFNLSQGWPMYEDVEKAFQNPLEEGASDLLGALHSRLTATNKTKLGTIRNHNRPFEEWVAELYNTIAKWIAEIRELKAWLNAFQFGEDDTEADRLELERVEGRIVDFTSLFDGMESIGCPFKKPILNPLTTSASLLVTPSPSPPTTEQQNNDTTKAANDLPNYEDLSMEIRIRIFSSLCCWAVAENQIVSEALHAVSELAMFRTDPIGQDSDGRVYYWFTDLAPLRIFRATAFALVTLQQQRKRNRQQALEQKQKQTQKKAMASSSSSSTSTSPLSIVLPVSTVPNALGEAAKPNELPFVQSPPAQTVQRSLSGRLIQKPVQATHYLVKKQSPAKKAKSTKKAVTANSNPSSTAALKIAAKEKEMEKKKKEAEEKKRIEQQRKLQQQQMENDIENDPIPDLWEVVCHDEESLQHLITKLEETENKTCRLMKQLYHIQKWGKKIQDEMHDIREEAQREIEKRREVNEEKRRKKELKELRLQHDGVVPYDKFPGEIRTSSRNQISKFNFKELSSSEEEEEEDGEEEEEDGEENAKDKSDDSSHEDEDDSDDALARNRPERHCKVIVPYEKRHGWRKSTRLLKQFGGDDAD